MTSCNLCTVLAVITVFLSAGGAGELFSTATPPPSLVHTRGVRRALAGHSLKHSAFSHTRHGSEQKLEWVHAGITRSLKKQGIFLFVY